MFLRSKTRSVVENRRLNSGKWRNGELLGLDFAVAEKDRLYRRLRHESYCGKRRAREI